MDKELKLFALEYIKLQENLSINQKMFLGEFVMRANDDQVKYLLFKGESKDKLTKEDLKHLKEISISTSQGGWGLDPNTIDVNIKGIGPGTALLASTAALALAIRKAVRIYKDHYSKYGKQCSHMKHGTDERKKCERSAQTKALQAKVTAFKQTIGKLCPKSKDPEKCKAGAQKKIIGIQQKIQKLNVK
jgi:hypothetical protein